MNKRFRIGRCRLYDPLGCSLSSRDELRLEFPVGDGCEGSIYLGAKPAHGISFFADSSRYAVPGRINSMGRFESKPTVEESSHPSEFFLEISVEAEASAPPAGLDEAQQNSNLLEQARLRESEFENILDMIAGIVGIRFHRQFVLEPLSEQPLARNGETPHYSHAGPSVEILEELSLNESGVKLLQAKTEILKDLPLETRRLVGLVSHWLQRAWRERDHLYGFMALFIPMEMVLSKVKLTQEAKQERRSMQRSIRRLISKQEDDSKDDLLEYFEMVRQKGSYLSLMQKFSALAEEAKLPGWQDDIEAFRQFNVMRNRLVHTGEKSASTRVNIGENQFRTLSDLVERYAAYAVFGDLTVYPSQWRPELEDTDVAATAPNPRLETDG